MSDQKKITTNKVGYDLWALFYDEYPNPTVAIDELTFPAFWQHLSCKKILEIGCGTGRHTAKLAALENSIVAIDQSTEMLRQAQIKLAGKSAALIEGDFLTVDGLQDVSFDAVIISLVMEHIEKLEPFLGKIQKLLKPAGELYISEIHPNRTAKGISAHFKDASGETEVHLQSYPHTQSHIFEEMQKTGFSSIKVTTVCGTEQLATINPKWKKYLDRPMIQIWVARKHRLVER